MKQYFSGIFLFLVLINGLLFEQSISAMGVLETQLTSLKGNLGGLKGKLGDLSSKLKDLNSALLGVVAKPASKGSAIPPAIPKELKDFLKSEIIKAKKAIISQLGNDASIKRIPEVQDKIKLLKSFQQKEISPHFNDKTLQNALKSKTIDDVIEIIFGHEDDVMSKCAICLNKGDTLNVMPKLSEGKIDPLRQALRDIQSIAETIKIATEKFETNQLEKSLKTKTDTFILTPISGADLDKEIAEIEKIKTIKDSKTGVTKNLEAFHEFSKKELLSELQNLSFKSFINVIDSGKLIQESIDNKNDFFENFKKILKNAKLLQHKFDEKIQDPFDKIEAFITEIEKIKTKIESEKSEEKKKAAEAAAKKEDDKKTVGKKDDKADIAKNIAFLQSMISNIEADPDYVKNLSVKDLDGTIGGGGLISNFYKNRAGYLHLTEAERETIKNAWLKLTDMWQTLPDKKSIQEKVKKRKQQLINILVYVLGLPYNDFVLGKLGFTAQTKMIGSKPVIVDPELKKIIEAEEATSGAGASKSSGGSSSASSLTPDEELNKITNSRKRSSGGSPPPLPGGPGGPPPPPPLPGGPGGPPPPPPLPGGPGGPPPPGGSVAIDPNKDYDLSIELTSDEIATLKTHNSYIKFRSALLKAALKILVEKKKAEFEKDAEGKEVLTALGIK